MHTSRAPRLHPVILQNPAYSGWSFDNPPHHADIRNEEALDNSVVPERGSRYPPGNSKLQRRRLTQRWWSRASEEPTSLLNIMDRQRESGSRPPGGQGPSVDEVRLGGQTRPMLYQSTKP
ncbi:hypothetical protein NDU88_002014 [Pleurodeles waltl]|uniref:Uncharacterized protein n=1 Tax=Pleurodeles waltl TaxID=8319 RepID=A0AAV7U9Q9_PLEWA|nr:hypothetical protein NDU88_002014 [Pleurodeles waltl]